MTTELQSPEEFANDMYARWMRENPGSHLQLATVLQLIQIAFYASLETEEGRPCVFSLAVVDCELMSRQPKRPWCPSLFTQTRSLSVQHIVKLAPACDPAQTHIAVDISSSGPTIRGLVRTNRDGERIARGELNSVTEIPDQFLVVRALAPGVIEVRSNSVRFGLLSKGVRMEEGAALFGNWTWLSSRLEHHAQQAGLDPTLCVTVIQSLLHRLARRRCGGTVLIAPDVPRDLKYANSFNAPSQALQEGIRFAAPKPLPSTPPSLPSTDGQLEEIRRKTPPTANAYLAVADVAAYAADLASVDGALVLTQTFTILGFGAKITSAATSAFTTWDMTKVTEPRKPVPFPLDDLGTRHNSAARWCRTNPQGLAFVVSQDQTVSCLRPHENGEDVEIWRPLMLELVPNERLRMRNTLGQHHHAG